MRQIFCLLSTTWFSPQTHSQNTLDKALKIILLSHYARYTKRGILVASIGLYDTYACFEFNRIISPGYASVRHGLCQSEYECRYIHRSNIFHQYVGNIIFHVFGVWRAGTSMRMRYWEDRRFVSSLRPNISTNSYVFCCCKKLGQTAPFSSWLHFFCSHELKKCSHESTDWTNFDYRRWSWPLPGRYSSFLAAATAHNDKGNNSAAYDGTVGQVAYKTNVVQNKHSTVKN